MAAAKSRLKVKSEDREVGTPRRDVVSSGSRHTPLGESVESGVVAVIKVPEVNKQNRKAAVNKKQLDVQNKMSNRPSPIGNSTEDYTTEKADVLITENESPRTTKKPPAGGRKSDRKENINPTKAKPKQISNGPVKKPPHKTTSLTSLGKEPDSQTSSPPGSLDRGKGIRPIKRGGPVKKQQLVKPIPGSADPTPQQPPPPQPPQPPKQSVPTTKTSPRKPAVPPPGPGREGLLLAQFDYEPRAKGDLGIRKGDILVLLEESDPEWWVAKQKYSNKQGHVPSSYVAKEGTLKAYSWWGGTLTLRDSERLLMRPRLPTGTFIVRESDKGNYILSVRKNDPNDDCTVKHYKIKPAQDGSGFCITLQRSFDTLMNLIRHYAHDAGALCCKLVYACPLPYPDLYDLSRETRGNWEISRNSIQFISEIGTGQFGEVWRGVWNVSNSGVWNSVAEVAIKTLKPGAMSAQAFMSEAHIMSQCKHVNLVRLYGVCSEEEPVYLVTEFMTKGSLVKFLRGREGRKLQLSHLVDIAAQIASGMSYLEKKKFIHRDLAARNILIGEDNIVKVADFGLAKSYEYNTNFGAIFPIKWTAPEAAFYGKFSVKSDVWSYGILLMEIFTYGQAPYAGIRNDQVLKKVHKGYRMPIPRDCSLPVYGMMQRCWDKIPAKRPSFDFLYNFFDSYYYTLKKINFPIL